MNTINNATHISKERNDEINDEFEKNMNSGADNKAQETEAKNETTLSEALGTVIDLAKQKLSENSGLTLFNQGNEIEKKDPLSIPTVDLSNGDLPDLDEADVVPLDMASNYWSPTQPGESKRVYFDKIQVVQVQDSQDKEVVIDLPCAYLFEKSNGEVKTYCNGSKRLVAIFERNHIERGTPILITYLGKKRNSTNAFLSDDWSVKPLILKIGK